MNNKEFLANVLIEINKIRVALGKKELNEIPKGVPTAISECPLAIAFGIKSLCSFGCFNEEQALKLYVNLGLSFTKVEEGDWIEKVWYRVDYPQILVDFATAFDESKFPQLIDNGGGLN